MDQLPEEVRKRAGDYQAIVGGVTDAMALLTARDLGVFDALLGGPLSLEELATACDVSPRRLRPFLDVVVVLDFLRRDGEAYGLVPGDEALFEPDGEAHHLLGFHPGRVTFEWAARAADVVREDRSIVMAGPGGEVDEAERRAFLAHLDVRSRGVAAEVARLLSDPAPARIADLGGGVGTYSHAFLLRNPEAEAWLLDRPNAEEAAREFASRVGVQDRMHFRGVDFLTEDWGDGYDLVILSNLVHCYGVEDNLRLLRDAAARLAPGGRIAVKDLVTDPDRRGPGSAVRFAMRMALYTDAGDVFPASEVEGWLTEVGLGEVRTLALEEAPEAYLVIGEANSAKPSL